VSRADHPSVADVRDRPETFSIRRGDVERCPVHSLVASHYRDDGSCRCHPDYRYAFAALPAEQLRRCRCGGVKRHHAVAPFGCDDCDCTEFTPIEEETDGLRA
jgi:hypothetical protein